MCASMSQKKKSVSVFIDFPAFNSYMVFHGERQHTFFDSSPSVDVRWLTAFVTPHSACTTVLAYRS